MSEAQIPKKLILMAGIAGSGKTTLAKKEYPDYMRISLDDIKRSRSEMGSLIEAYKPDGLPVPASNNRKAEHVLIDNALQKGQNIIVDDTNLTRDIRRHHVLHAGKYGHVVHVIAFCNFERAKSQNKLRHGEECVPDGVVHKMQRDFESPRIEEGFESIRTIF